jgi:hypothetical protein
MEWDDRMRKYVEYKNRNEFGEIKIIKGIFEIIKETDNFIKIKTNKGNILTIPFHNIEKIKERENGFNN